MKILLLIDRLEMGGAETHVITLARALAQRGNCVCVLSAGGGLEPMQSGGIRYLHFSVAPTTATGWLRCFFELRRLLRREHFDVLHAHTRRTALMLRLVPKAALPADLDPQMLSTYRRRAVLRKLAPLRVVTAHAMFSPRARRLSYWGDTTVAVSEDIRRHLQQHFGCKNAISVIGNGIEPDNGSRVTDDTVFSVVFASRLDHDCSRAAMALLHIAPALEKAARQQGRALRLTLLGGGACYPTLCRTRNGMVAAGELSPDCVTLTGAVPASQPYFRQARVFVGVSRAALEAAGCACAVVLAGNEGYGGTLTCDNFDRYAASNLCCRGEEEIREERLLADLLTLLQMPPAQLQRQADALLPRLRHEYDVSLTAARTQRLYVRALSQKRRLDLLCVGYFGRQNLGDESILRCLLRRFSGAKAPVSLSDAPWQGTPAPALAVVHACHARGKSTDYHARRELHLSCGADVPAFGMRYKGRIPRGREQLSGHRDAASIPLRLRTTVLCHRPQQTSVGWRYGGARAIPRGHLCCLLGSLWKSDALLLGGGSLLQNASRHGRRSLAFYLSLPLLGRLLGCPFSLRANGIGPLRGSSARGAVGLVLRRAAGISLREEHSAHLLERCGVSSERMSFCPDAVAIWAERHAGKVAAPPWRNYVCICPRETDEGTLLQLLALADTRWAGEHRVYVAMDEREDAAACRRLASLASGRVVVLHSERAALGLLSGADAVISMRLHALLLAGKDTPRIAVPTRATEDKMRG